jgi:dolichyl-phosphate-mannose-protein mannosyltransferase
LDLTRTSRLNRTGFRRWPIAAIGVAAIVAIAAAGPARAATNLLLNGDLSKGAENQPDNWRTEAWINGPDAIRYTWLHPTATSAGIAEVENLKPDDGRWMQPLILKPGWYHCSVQLRTENVGAAATGASISLMEDGIMSSEVRGTADWQRVGFYVRVSGHGADVDIALRVGGFGSLNVGRAFFRDARVEQVAAPPPGADRVFDLTAIRRASATAPIGTPITLVLTFMALVAVAMWGWLRFPWNPPAQLKSGTPKPKPGKRK